MTMLNSRGEQSRLAVGHWLAREHHAEFLFTVKTGSPALAVVTGVEHSPEALS